MKGTNTILIGSKNILLFTFFTTNQSELKMSTMNEMITSQSPMITKTINKLQWISKNKNIFYTRHWRYFMECFSLVDYKILSYIRYIFRYSNISSVLELYICFKTHSKNFCLAHYFFYNMFHVMSIRKLWWIDKASNRCIYLIYNHAWTNIYLDIQIFDV